jgi:hypothetical protein
MSIERKHSDSPKTQPNTRCDPPSVPGARVIRRSRYEPAKACWRSCCLRRANRRADADTRLPMLPPEAGRDYPRRARQRRHGASPNARRRPRHSRAMASLARAGTAVGRRRARQRLPDCPSESLRSSVVPFVSQPATRAVVHRVHSFSLSVLPVARTALTSAPRLCGLLSLVSRFAYSDERTLRAIEISAISRTTSV